MKRLKFIKTKSLAVSCFVCLLPILAGTAVWQRLPETVATHFDLYGRPDGFASKNLVVFGLPILMMFLQAFCCLINDANAAKHGERAKFERVVKSIIPILTLVLQSVTLGYGLGARADIRRIVAVLVGVVLIVIGNYQPKLDYVKDYDRIDTEKARKINRFIGFATVIEGIVFLISIFFPPKASLIAVFLLIPYAAVCVIYGIKVGKG